MAGTRTSRKEGAEGMEGSPAPPAQAPAERARGTGISGLDLLIAAAMLAVLVVVAWQYAFPLIFSRFRPYDDEGYLIVAVKRFSEGAVLYEDLFSWYGPAYYLVRTAVHEWLGWPLTHDGVRLATLSIWLGAASTCAVIVHRMTRSLVLSAVVFFQSVLHLNAMANEPGHPQELCVLGVSLAVLAATFVRSGAPSPVPFVSLGSIVALVFLMKVNLGVYLGLAVVLGLIVACPRSRPRWLLGGAIAAATTLLPFLVLRPHLQAEWGWSYAVIVSAGWVAAMVTAVGVRPAPEARFSHLFLVVGGGAVVSLAVAVFILACGTSLPSLFDGLLVQPFRFPGTFSIPAPLTDAPATWALAALGAAILSVPACRSRLAGRHVIRFLNVVKIGYGLAIFYVGSYHAGSSTGWFLAYAIPMLWLILVPAAPGGGGGLPTLPRVMLCLVAILQALQAYPVYGSQAHWATFLLVPAGAVSIADGLRALLGERASRWASWRATMAGRAVAVGAVVVVATWQHTQADMAGPGGRYQRLAPLGLPGAAHLRLPAERVATYQWLVKSLHENCDVFLTMPSFHSLHLWTGIAPPRSMTGQWRGISRSEQVRIVEEMERYRRPCFLDQSMGIHAMVRPPFLSEHVRRSYTPAFSREIYRILVKSDQPRG